MLHLRLFKKMTNITSHPHKSGFRYLRKKSSFGELQKFPFASFHKCVIGRWCLTPRRQVFVFPFLKPKVGLFRFSQADYSHGSVPEEEKIIISLNPARPRPGPRLRVLALGWSPDPGPCSGSWVSIVLISRAPQSGCRRS